MIKTVKDLKDFLNNLPDDALVYEQITPRGKHLEAVDPRTHYESSIWEEDYLEFSPGYNVINYYDFPEFVQVPLDTKSALEYLEYYTNKNSN